jgi:MoxR-like ATPase
VIPDDVKYLAEPVLAHRILMKGLRQEASPQRFLREILDRVSAPTEKRA